MIGIERFIVTLSKFVNNNITIYNTWTINQIKSKTFRLQFQTTLKIVDQITSSTSSKPVSQYHRQPPASILVKSPPVSSSTRSHYPCQLPASILVNSQPSNSSWSWVLKLESHEIIIIKVTQLFVFFEFYWDKFSRITVLQTIQKWAHQKSAFSNVHVYFEEHWLVVARDFLPLQSTSKTQPQINCITSDPLISFQIINSSTFLYRQQSHRSTVGEYGSFIRPSSPTEPIWDKNFNQLTT